MASWRAAKLRQAAGAVPLTAASAAGLYLEICGSAAEARAKVVGPDDFSVRVRQYLDRVAEDEKRAEARVG